MASVSDRASQPVRPLRRILAGGAALALTALAAASCTMVLSLDDYNSAADAICDLLDGCYASGVPKSCVAHITTIEEATPAEADQWLHAIGKGCLDNCTAARICLDVQPVCEAEVPGPCSVKEDCCGFSKGSRDCSPEGTCCVTAGQRCLADADCCPGIGVCNPITETCGGTQCRDGGAPCDIGEQCCSGHCRDKTCSNTICDDDGFTCTTDGACCSGYCDKGRCGRPKECGLLRAPCVADEDCCAKEGSAGSCYVPPGAPQGLCSTASTCAPIEADCSSDAQCCSAHCDPTYHKCGEACLAVAKACTLDAECCSGSCQDGTCATACSSAYCAVNEDCCTKRCIAGTCAPECSTTTCVDHTPCKIGAPLGSDCPGTGLCVSLICQIDPYCCCNAWDSFCVLEALNHKGDPACLGLCP